MKNEDIPKNDVTINWDKLQFNPHPSDQETERLLGDYNTEISNELKEQYKDKKLKPRHPDDAQGAYFDQVFNDVYTKIREVKKINNTTEKNSYRDSFETYAAYISYNNPELKTQNYKRSIAPEEKKEDDVISFNESQDHFLDEEFNSLSSEEIAAMLNIESGNNNKNKKPKRKFQEELPPKDESIAQSVIRRRRNNGSLTKAK